MSLTERVLGERRQITAPWAGFLRGDSFSTASKAGVVVNDETLMGVAAAWSCATLLADVVSMLPVHHYRRAGGLRERVDSPAPIVQRPSRIFSRREWIFQAVISSSIFGNTYGQVIAREERPSDMRRTGIPEIVELVAPSVMRVSQVGQMSRPTYEIAGTRVPTDDIVHLRRYPKVGSAVGMSPLDRHKDLIGVAAAARDFAASWFGDGAHPSSLLINDNQISEEIAKEAKKRWTAAGRSREPRTLGSGWKYQSVQSTPADSELLETWNRVATDVCQVFRVPPEMIGIASSGQSVTYANREQRSIDFLTFSVEPWLAMFEDWWTDLLPDDEFAKFNPDALLRVDTMTRHKVHDLAIRAGLASVNERRRLEDMPPIATGDQFLWPPYRGFPLEGERE